MDTERDEPLTPSGRLFLRPELGQIISCAVGVKLPIDVEAVRAEIGNSIITQHPRFCSLMVRDRHGREHWRRTNVDLDRHMIVRNKPVGYASDEAVINDYLADLAVSSPLSVDKPLWEIHLLMAHNCAVLRVHHALGDGISLMSIFLSCCRMADDPNQRPTFGSVSSSSSNERSRREWTAWKVLKMVWFTLVYVLEFMVRCLFMKDNRTAVSGGSGMELWPRKLATAKFRLEDMKTVKKAVANATINDVLFGVVSLGLSKYLDIRSPKAVQDGIQMAGVAIVNLRPQQELQDIEKLMKSNPKTEWGNKFGMTLLPVCYNKDCSDPLKFVKRAKTMIDKKKLSLEAIFSYKIFDFVMSWFGPKFACLLNYRIICNTTFTISNVVGPKEEITIVGNPVTYIRANTSSLPHAITMHMLSYAGRVDVQILVAKDIIPDPEVLARCFEESLLKTKAAAMAATKT